MDSTTILVIGGVFAFVLLIIGLFVSAREERSLVDQRLEYLEEDVASVKGERGAAVADWINKQATQFTWGQRLSRSLARADIKLRIGEYILVVLFTTVGGAALGWYLGGGARLGAEATLGERLLNLPAILIGGVVGYLAPILYVRREQGRRLVRFDAQLADMLNLMVNGIRAGYSIMQAMESVAKELPPPISEEFRRIVQEMQLGVSLGAALDNLIRRIPSKDLDLVVTAINVQREVGGNLAEILDKISHTIRERVRVKGEIRVLTTQVLYSGRILALMPVALIIAMYFVNRSYMMRFFATDTRFIGIPALIIGAVLIVVGYFAMTRLADIEI